jgi:hypothetical protein
LLHTWFTLLQDEDFEVRQAASTATMKLCCFQHPNVAITTLSWSKNSTSCSVSAPCQFIVCSMFSFLYYITDDVGNKMKAVVDKLLQFDDSESFPVFVNDTITQAIFEAENPNSYIESCVTCQLAVVAIINMTESVLILD